MTDERFEELMREAARTYNPPPPEPPYEEMWLAVDRALTEAPARREDARVIALPARRSRGLPGWLKAAAMLAIGFGIGRMSLPVEPEPAIPAVAAGTSVPASRAYSGVTDRYLGETAALLIALPTELRSNSVDSAFYSRADELLLQTRLLLDSPAAAEPGLRGLFEDLEMVLVQIVRLQADRDSTHIELLNEALEQGNVLPRLRTAVVEHIGD